MSKPWKPGKQTVELAPSRIRREPVRLDSPAAARPRSREREMRMAVIGVALLALSCAGLIVGVSEVTSHRGTAAPAATEAFGYCRTGGGGDCVLDGGTFYLGGRKIGIAGIDAPQMHPSRCAQEAQAGVQAAVRLHELLNRGEVTLTPAAPQPDAHGRLLHRVEVDGRDVAPILVEAGVARELAGGPRSWCEQQPAL